MKKRTRPIIPAVIFCTIIVSIFFRLLFHYSVLSLGDEYLDSETGVPFILEYDCYYHLRMTRDIALYGHPGDTLKDGEPWDSQSYAPEGRSADDYKPLMAYIAIAVRELISVFRPVSLEQTVYWLNAFISALIVIPVFLFTYEMSGLAGAITASVLSALNFSYYTRSLPGFYDTDGVILWVSCFFFYFGIQLLKGWQEKNKKSMILNGTGFIVSLAALYNSWYVHYMFPGLLVGALILFTLLTLITGTEKRHFYSPPLLLSAFVCAAVLILEKGLIVRAVNLFTRVSSKESSVFPNVFNSISELQKPPLFGERFFDLFVAQVFPYSNLNIINSSGGIVPFLFAAVMCVILIVHMVRKDIRPEYLLLLLWYGVTLWLSLHGTRFIMLFAVPAAILAGILTEDIVALADKKNRIIRYVIKCIIFVSLLSPSFYSAYKFASEPPLLPDGPMAEDLAKIRENTPENTILASWWDYGYFLEEKSGRRALFDGGSASDDRCYFVARALATADEELSANIFHMLCGSGDKGTDLMLSTFGKTEETVLFIDELLSGGKEEAREKLLKKDLSEDRVREITELLFPENLPPVKCVITPDMPDIYEWFSILGFSISKEDDKPADFKEEVVMMPADFSKNRRNAIDTGNGYYVIIENSDSGYDACTSDTEEPSGEQPFYIEKLIIMDDNGYGEYIQSNELPSGDDPDPGKDALPWTAIMKYNGQEYTLSLLSSSLADSVFGRMYFLDGAGLTRYKAEPELSGEALVYGIL